MDDKLKSIIESKANLEDYFDEYRDNSDFLYHYFSQDISRILDTNYLLYGDKLSISDNVKLAKIIILRNFNYDMFDRIISTILRAGWPKEAEAILSDVFKYVDDKKIDLDKLNNYVKSRYYRANPLKAIENSPNNIIYISNVKSDEFKYIVDRLRSGGYLFTKENDLFLQDNVYNNYDNFIYFINNSKFDIDISEKLNKSLSDFNSDELHDCYQKCNNKEIKKTILKMLNYHNYNLDTIIKNEDIYLMYDNNKNQILDLLKGLKNSSFSKDIILQMNRVDMDFINEAEKIIGDNLKISPIINQDIQKKATGPWNYKSYTVDEIRKSEAVFDLYTNTVSDIKDKDGEIKSLSPLEKYVAAYILTTKFAPYTPEDNITEDYNTSRSVYEFMDKITNRKIVCTGYVHLLREFLYRMGLKDTIRWDVHSHKEELKGYMGRNNHSRMIIHLVDSKYNIDGLYMSDPTWDEGFGLYKHAHMLMAQDEIKNVDPEFTNQDLHLDEMHKIEEALNVNDAHTLFNKKIPKEAIIKAYLAVEHFLDKNMKMVKNDSEYKLLEFCDMAQRLGYDDIIRQKNEEIYQELLQMKPSEIVGYSNLIGVLDSNLSTMIEKKSETDYSINILKGKEDDNIYVNLSGNTKNVDISLISEEYKTTLLNKKIFSAQVYVMKDKPILEQYAEIMDSIRRFHEIVDNNSLENSENRLK